MIDSDEEKHYWVEGAEVLITYHTHEWEDNKVLSIVRVEPHDIPGFVRLQVDGAIRRPTAMQDTEQYATEVALLSRNIVLDGGQPSGPVGSEDTRDHPGTQRVAHMVVLHTLNFAHAITVVKFSKR